MNYYLRAEKRNRTSRLSAYKFYKLYDESFFIQAEEESVCLIGFPYTLKVSNNLIKDIFLFSGSKYISVLLYSVLLLAVFTQTQRLFQAQVKHTILPVCLCPDIHDGAFCDSQVPVASVLPYHDRNRELYLFR